MACLVNSPSALNATVNCVAQDTFPNAVEGFTTDGSTPCVVGTCEGAVSVEGGSWGRVKSLYR